jgi:hypothetical protein
MTLILIHAPDTKITDLDILRYIGNMADTSSANLKKREVIARQHLQLFTFLLLNVCVVFHVSLVLTLLKALAFLSWVHLKRLVQRCAAISQ